MLSPTRVLRESSICVLISMLFISIFSGVNSENSTTATVVLTKKKKNILLLFPFSTHTKNEFHTTNDAPPSKLSHLAVRLYVYCALVLSVIRNGVPNAQIPSDVYEYVLKNFICVCSALLLVSVPFASQSKFTFRKRNVLSLSIFFNILVFFFSLLQPSELRFVSYFAHSTFQQGLRQTQLSKSKWFFFETKESVLFSLFFCGKKISVYSRCDIVYFN